PGRAGWGPARRRLRWSIAPPRRQRLQQQRRDAWWRTAGRSAVEPGASSRSRHRTLGRAMTALHVLDGETHSTEMLANFTTLAHFAVSSTTSLPKSAADIGMGVPPSCATRSCIFGSASAAVTALLRISIASGGMTLGPAMPYHTLAP